MYFNYLLWPSMVEHTLDPSTWVVGKFESSLVYRASLRTARAIQFLKSYLLCVLYVVCVVQAQMCVGAIEFSRSTSHCHYHHHCPSAGTSGNAPMPRFVRAGDSNSGPQVAEWASFPLYYSGFSRGAEPTGRTYTLKEFSKSSSVKIITTLHPRG